MSAAWLWFGPMRISTEIMIVLFIATALWSRRWLQGVTACAAWLVGFEVFWAWSSWATGHAWTMGPAAPPLAFMLWGPGWILASWLSGLRPWLPMVGLVGLAWTIWLLTGFDSNWPLPGHPFSWRAEILNEVAKTAWGLAYLVPLARHPHFVESHQITYIPFQEAKSS